MTDTNPNEALRTQLRARIVAEYRQRGRENAEYAVGKRAMAARETGDLRERFSIDADDHRDRAGLYRHAADAWESRSRDLPDLDLNDPSSILRFLVALPQESMLAYEVKKAMGLTLERYYFAFDNAPIGTTVYLIHRLDPPDLHLGTRTEHGWKSSTLPPTDGHSATFCHHFWRGIAVYDATVVFPEENGYGRPQVVQKMTRLHVF